MSKRPSSSDASEVPAKKSAAFHVPSGALRQTEKVLMELCSEFPVEKFGRRVPPVIMKHMLYSRISDRTRVDREIDELRRKGTIRVFKVGSDLESQAVLFKDSYSRQIEERCSASPVVGKFVTILLERVRDVAVDKTTLAELGFTEADIRDLVQQGLLNMKSASSLWFSFPGAGEFMKAYLKGRNALISAVKKSKYQQILRSELQARDMKKSVPLSIHYHIDDIIGSDVVSVVSTSSGDLLRLDL